MKGVRAEASAVRTEATLHCLAGLSAEGGSSGGGSLPASERPSLPLSPFPNAWQCVRRLPLLALFEWCASGLNDLQHCSALLCKSAV